MSRLIDADALIADLAYDVQVDEDSLVYEELSDDNRTIIQFDKDCKQNAIDILNHAPTIEPERKWIPCSERLPEEEMDVLVTVHFLGLQQTHPNGWNDHIKPNYYVEVASRIDGEWKSYSDEYKVARNRHKVIAWMPLPESYRGDEDGK